MSITSSISSALIGSLSAAAAGALVPALPFAVVDPLLVFGSSFLISYSNDGPALLHAASVSLATALGQSVLFGDSIFGILVWVFVAELFAGYVLDPLYHKLFPPALKIYGNTTTSNPSMGDRESDVSIIQQKTVHFFTGSATGPLSIHRPSLVDAGVGVGRETL